MTEKNVALVSYAVQSKGPVPSGLMLEGGAHLAGRLLQNGYVPTVYDFNNVNSIKKISQEGKEEFLDDTINQLHEKIQKDDIRLIGFTLYTNGFKDNIKIAQELKKRNPGLMIAAGGPLVGWFEEEIFTYTDTFDILVRGEGDQAIVALADMVYNNASLSAVPGAIYQTNIGINKNKKIVTDISSLPFPIYDQEVYPDLDSKIKVSTLRTTVGCRWGRCNFCPQPKIDGRYRERDIENVLAEIEHLKSNHGIRKFRLADPNPSPEQLRKLFDGLPDDVKISCFAYSDQNYDFDNSAKNLLGLFIGIESMDPVVLSSLNKTDHPKEYIGQCKEMLAEAKRHGIATVYANIVPTANDTTERIRKDLENVIELQPDFITALPLAPIPGTPLYRKILKDGEKTGVRLNPKFLKELMLYELDLLNPSSWRNPPFQLKVDGKFIENPFTTRNELFSDPLAKQNIQMASDEIVLMAHLYHEGLDQDQDRRRVQVNEFQNRLRADVSEGDHQDLEKMVDQMNQSNTDSR
ncbi:MAG: radical SAM protein [Candidatus Woesearchaeota archaeon]